MTDSPNSAHERLFTLAQNLWWTWHPEVIRIFTDLNPQKWREFDHNPISFLNELSSDEIEKRASELMLHSNINSAFRRLNEYLNPPQTWGSVHCGNLHEKKPVVYFSAEFGLHESLPIYSGGLGILAGDHLKSASDLGIPLIGIGLLYNQGYFSQHLDEAGWQKEDYTDLKKEMLPLQPVTGKDNDPLMIRIDTNTGFLEARIWKLQVGRIPLYLLDSDVEGNSDEDRELTSRLYSGGERIRIRQELLLGVGGAKVLQALGIFPGVLHLNEGHSGFAILEEIRRVMHDDGISFERARRRVSLYTAFTTHTPVAAGHDRFPPELVEEHLGKLRGNLGISGEDFLALGRVNPGDSSETFCMTVLALKNSRKANGVSAIHGDVSRRMWRGLWPDRREVEIPIGHITNGVHVLSWLAPQMRSLFDARIGQHWSADMTQPGIWEKISNIDDEELWEIHKVLQMRLIRFVRRRLCEQEKRPGCEKTDSQMEEFLDPAVLTIGWARRFAKYKRGDLILPHPDHPDRPDRLLNLMENTRHPIQIIFAGKAHPDDNGGKEVIQRIIKYRADNKLEKRIVFVEDYDYNVARHLIQGVDVWLNTPLRPLEACGTSGQKIVLNGGLNLSILDGWWNEGYNGRNGFAIGHGEMHNEVRTQNQRDANYLFDALEEEVIPLYYNRDEKGVPRQWVQRVKEGMRGLGWRFNADRMVRDYVERVYLPTADATSAEG